MSFGTRLNLSDCGLTSLGTDQTHTPGVEELAGRRNAGPFSGIIMEVNGIYMGAGSTASEDSTLDLSHNDLTLITFDALRAPFKITDLSYNRIREYEAGWASVILDNAAEVFTVGNPSVCNVSGMSALGDLGPSLGSPGTMTLSQLNQGYLSVQTRIQCSCNTTLGLAGTGAFCADHPCQPLVLAKLNQAKTISSGYYYNPGGKNVPVSTGDKLSVKCNAGYTLVDSPVNDAMICQGGLYAVPAEGEAPTCAQDQDQLILIVALIVVIFACNGWLMKNCEELDTPFTGNPCPLTLLVTPLVSLLP